MNDDKFDQYSRIIFIISLIVFFLSDGADLLRVISGFIAFFSGWITISTLLRKNKEEKERTEFNEKMQKIKTETSTPVDNHYFLSEIGKYNNEGNIWVHENANASFYINRIVKLVEFHSETSQINDFIVYLRTNSILGEEKENTIRHKIAEVNGKIVILKDCSSLNTPEGEYDINVIIVKVSLEGFKAFIGLFRKNEIRVLNICDDYNPNIFSEKDTYLAVNENYTFKFVIFQDTQKYSLILRYGYVPDLESHAEKLERILITPSKKT